jgi:predicted nuclease with TOPRIM domain
MSENIRDLPTEAIVSKQFKEIRQEFKEEFKENRQEIRELTKLTHENALSIKELVGALSESSLESRYTRNDVKGLADRFDKFADETDDRVEILEVASAEKKANQKLIIAIYSAILASIFTFGGWLFGKS